MTRQDLALFLVQQSELLQVLPAERERHRLQLAQRRREFELEAALDASAQSASVRSMSVS